VFVMLGLALLIRRKQLREEDAARAAA
jgi:hypothetical protein